MLEAGKMDGHKGKKDGEFEKNKCEVFREFFFQVAVCSG